MIDVSFCGDTMEEIRAQVRDFLGDVTSTIVIDKVAPPKIATTPQASAPVATGAISYQQVVDKGQALVKAKGKPALVAVLATFNAKGGKELKEEQYAEFMQKADAALAS